MHSKVAGLPPHPGSVETYEFIADWIAPELAYSRKDVWHRFGFLGVFSDYVLASMQGAVLEIGVGESSIYLGRSASKYGRRIYHCDIAPSKITNPMTVPGYIAEDLTYFEERDPTPDSFQRAVAFAGPSDELFKRVPIEPLALAFIDGDHNFAQAHKDFFNCWALLKEDGFILLHDTYPPSKDYVDENRCGDVYRLRQQLEHWSACDCLTLTQGAAMGVGLSIVRKKPRAREYFQE